jgi:hypothetical protein
VENAENSQEDSRPAVATMTVTTARQMGGVADGESGESRRTAGIFGETRAVGGTMASRETGAENSEENNWLPKNSISNRFLHGPAIRVDAHAPSRTDS